MPLPPLTALQFAVLDALGAIERSGRDVRAILAKRGIRRDGPAFYQLMSRLEDAGLVKGHYKQKTIDGQIVKERRYSISGAGASALRDTLMFYRPTSARWAVEEAR